MSGLRLSGLRVVVTRPRQRSEELCFLLEEEGAEVVALPMLELEPPTDARGLRAAADTLGRFSWVAFASPAGVESLVEAARTEFVGSGYDSTSMRAVARRAGVDAALVHHYFADKADLFAATVEVPLRPHQLVTEILRGPRDAIGATIIGIAVHGRVRSPACSGE